MLPCEKNVCNEMCCDVLSPSPGSLSILCTYVTLACTRESHIYTDAGLRGFVQCDVGKVMRATDASAANEV